ncbi:hypothetical protein DUNSADRAFT_18017 [Dunaliella salina]|uniref:Uncharacterized protein n=1 Tax=Dunaliella salina TaxID=3046 RepID=A0ABQ7G0T9_DUNSA|nr:hypothetical protein DUNSADRAFT_18017 [Dunaliella salina]|eukprot:KAF5828213.1 hypothetical protein DUNSADRAFT_18017 [Dunaliella salina]
MSSAGRAAMLLVCAVTAAVALLDPVGSQHWAQAAMNTRESSQVVASLSTVTPAVPPGVSQPAQPTLVERFAHASLQLLQFLDNTNSAFATLRFQGAWTYPPPEQPIHLHSMPSYLAQRAAEQFAFSTLTSSVGNWLIMLVIYLLPSLRQNPHFFL